MFIVSPTGRKSDVEYGKKTQFPLLSVVVPIYNAQETLFSALTSAVEQSSNGLSLEIICVNDASPDDSKEIICDFATKYPEITVVTHSQNAGYGASVNDGIDVARGKWIGILEPDDLLVPGAYAKMFAALAKNGGKADIIKAPYIREIRDEGMERGKDFATRAMCSYDGRVTPIFQPFKIGDPGTTHIMRHHPSIWSAIYRKDFLTAQNISLKEYPGSGWADNEFFYETMLAAERVVYTDSPVYIYREETPSEHSALLLKNPDLVFDRWASMSDIIDRRGAAAGVKQAHAATGLTYLSSVEDALGKNDPTVAERRDEMFDRIDIHAVTTDPTISPAMKIRVGAHQKTIVKPSPLPYMASLGSAFFASLRSNGIGYAVDQVKTIIKK